MNAIQLFQPGLNLGMKENIYLVFCTSIYLHPPICADRPSSWFCILPAVCINNETLLCWGWNEEGGFSHSYDFGFLLLFQWKQNAPTLARWAIGQTLMINQLIDMEWKFGGN